MSERKLYAIEKFGGDVTLAYRLDAGALVAVGKLGNKVGVLVKVEPDYEAAAQIYATDYENDWETMSKGDRDFAIASVKEYVDAALEGDNDE